jgi:hypothetical protein
MLRSRQDQRVREVQKKARQAQRREFTCLVGALAVVPTEEINEATRREWRELGFFYDRIDNNNEWLVLGSRCGLRRFAELVCEYASDPRNFKLSEHQHFGPYMYMEIGTWHGPEITRHWIAGTPDDLKRLSAIIREKVAKATCGDKMLLRQEYAPKSPYELWLEIRDDGFDPAGADSGCW